MPRFAFEKFPKTLAISFDDVNEYKLMAIDKLSKRRNLQKAFLELESQYLWLLKLSEEPEKFVTIRQSGPESHSFPCGGLNLEEMYVSKIVAIS